MEGIVVLIIIAGVFHKLYKMNQKSNRSSSTQYRNNRQRQHKHQMRMHQQMHDDAQRMADQAHRDAHNLNEMMNKTHNYM